MVELPRPHEHGRAPVRILAPALVPPGHAPDGPGSSAAARRFLDLQAGSIWNDLAASCPQSRGVVLDVGCGAQPYRHLLVPTATYKAIDYAGAERHFGYSMPDTTYYEGDRWPIADGRSTSSSAPRRSSTSPSRPSSWPRHFVA